MVVVEVREVRIREGGMRQENAQLYAARAGGRRRSDRRLDVLKLPDCCSKITKTYFSSKERNWEN